jgi:hypothetical protein
MTFHDDQHTPRPPHTNGNGTDGSAHTDEDPSGAGTPPQSHPRAAGHHVSSSTNAQRFWPRTSASRVLDGDEREADGVLIGEIVEASSTEFLAQACELDSAPPFGAFVEVVSDDGFTVFGVVAQVETTGIDPGSRAIMRGHGDVRDERIYEENPDLPLVLRTTFRALVVGFAEGQRLYQFLPPRPPRLHYSVFVCAPATVRTFTSSGLDYLVPLLNATDVAVDEVLAASLRHTARQYHDRGEFLQVAGRELAQLLRADYARLTAILRRCLAPGEVV